MLAPLRFPHSLVALSATLLLVGCGGGGSDDRDKVSVSGKVTNAGAAWDGSNYEILFAPDDGTPPVSMSLDSSGAFSGSVVPGGNKVCLVAKGDGGGGSGHGAGGGVPAQYFAIDQTPWSKSVSSGDSLTLDIDPAATGGGGGGAGGGGHGG